MNNPLISVIIPVYNAQKYLRGTLQSVQQQTFKDFEVISIDDGSTDESWQILQNMAAKDARFKVYRQNNAGGSASRNKGLALAKGKYIAFLDNDDFYHPQYLEILYSNLLAGNADISCCSYVRFNGEGTYVFPQEKIAPHIDFISENPFFDKFVKRKKIDTLMWTKLYKRELFNNTEFALSLPAINDMLLNIEILLKAQKAVVCQEKLIAYRIIDTSQTMKPLGGGRIIEYKNLAVEINKLSVAFPIQKSILHVLATKYAYGMCVKEYLQRYNPQKDSDNYTLLQTNLHSLLQSGQISYQDLNWRRRIILWAFLRQKFRLLRLIKE